MLWRGTAGTSPFPRHTRNFRDLLIGQFFYFAQHDGFPKIGGKLLHAPFNGPCAFLPKRLGLGRGPAAHVAFLVILVVIRPRAVIAQPRERSVPHNSEIQVRLASPRKFGNARHALR